MISGVAGRYASALFELARDQRAVDAVAGDLDRFDALLRESPDLQRLVRSPVFTAEEQGKAIGAILDQAGIGGVGRQLLPPPTPQRRPLALPHMIPGHPELGADTQPIVRAAGPLG